MTDNHIVDTSPFQQVKKKRAKIREVDALRGIAIILMITGHSFIVHPINIQNTPWRVSLGHWIYTFHMELFFLLAGCVYHCSNYYKYINKKIDRLIVPYLAFGLISLLLHSAGLEAVNKQMSLGAGFIKLLSQGGSYWFLYALFVLFLIYPFIEKICKQPWMEFAVAVVCIVLFEFVKLPGIFELNRVVYYIPFFVLGRYSVKLLQSDKVNSNFLNIAILATSLVTFISMDRLFKIYPEVIIIVYVRAVAIILALYVPVHYLLRCVDNGSRVAKLIETILNNCSTYSLQLYLFNGFILVIVRTLLVSIAHIYNPVAIVSSLVVSNLLITLMICNYIIPKSNWLAWLCGIGNRH